MKVAVWNWTKVVICTPFAIASVSATSPLLGMLAAYDLAFLGWGSRK